MLAFDFIEDQRVLIDRRLVDIGRYSLGRGFYDSLQVGGQLVPEFFIYIKFIFASRLLPAGVVKFSHLLKAEIYIDRRADPLDGVDRVHLQRHV